MKIKFNRWFLVLILLLVSGIIFGAIKNRNMISLSMIAYSGFQSSDGRVFYSDKLDAEIRKQLELSCDSAIKRNELFWGERPLAYKLIFCATNEELKKYSNNHQTVSYCTLFGNYIVLCKVGFSKNIISHEMCHTKLWSNVGGGI